MVLLVSLKKKIINHFNGFPWFIFLFIFHWNYLVRMNQSCMYWFLNYANRRAVKTHVTEQLKYNFWSMTLQRSFLGVNLTLPAALGIILERPETKSGLWLQQDNLLLLKNVQMSTGLWYWICHYSVKIACIPGENTTTTKKKTLVPSKKKGHCWNKQFQKGGKYLI